MTFDRLIDLLKDQRIRFTQYFDQNDLYECTFALLPPKSEKSQARIDDYAAERAEVETVLRSRYFQFGMLCLAENYDNMLMWAHYANNHRGIVVGFDTSHFFFNSKEIEYDFNSGLEVYTNTEDLGKVKPVKYLRKRKIISYGGEYTLEELFFTKSYHWEYEREYRMLKNVYEREPAKILETDERIYLIGFPKECIADITFGVRCDESMIEKAMGLVVDNFASTPKLFQAKLAHLSFNIVRKPLSFEA